MAWGKWLAVALACGTLPPLTAYGETRLYISNQEQYSQNLHHVDPASGAWLGAFPGYDCAGYIAGTAYDEERDVLYCSGTGTDMLYTFDLSTGHTTEIGPFGVELIHGLAFDPSTRFLYGTYGWSGGDGLYRIDSSTGAATLMGYTDSFTDHCVVLGLAIHPSTHELYGSFRAGTYPDFYGGLMRIDKNTGASTLVGVWDDILQGLDFNPETEVLYGVSNQWPHTIYTIDEAAGTYSVVATTSLSNMLSLVFTPEPATAALLGLGALVLLASRRRHGDADAH